MNKTYEEILANMKSAYFSESGDVPNENSPEYKRLQAVASELYALSTYGDYIFRQAFIQTASSECLDKHGQLRGCTRKTASKSKGKLVFSVAEPATEDIIIPKGTVCSVTSQPLLQYATQKQAVIKAGTYSVSVDAQSLGYGEKYNVGENEITVMVNAPVGITSVNNPQEFIGSSDEENDIAYRNRIMSVYRAAPNGIGVRAMENTICDFDFVKDCRISYSPARQRIEIVAVAKQGNFTAEQEKMIVNSVVLKELLGTEVCVIQANVRNYSLVAEVNVRLGFDKNEIKKEVEDIITASSASLRIGEALQLSKISKQLVKIDAVSDFNIYSEDAYNDVIICDSNSYLYLKDLAVNCFEE